MRALLSLNLHDENFVKNVLTSSSLQIKCYRSWWLLSPYLEKGNEKGKHRSMSKLTTFLNLGFTKFSSWPHLRNGSHYKNAGESLPRAALPSRIPAIFTHCTELTRILRTQSSISLPLSIIYYTAPLIHLRTSLYHDSKLSFCFCRNTMHTSGLCLCEREILDPHIFTASSAPWGRLACDLLSD